MRVPVALIFTFFSLSTYSQKEVVRKIIDVHFHARSFNDYGNPPFPNPITGKRPEWKSDKEVIQMTLDTLRKYGIVKAVASGNLFRTADYHKADSARFISSLEYPDRQNSPLPDTATFIRLIVERKIFVFGELGLQYEGKVLTDPELEPYLAICERLGIPVALHTGLGAPNSPYTCCPKFRTTLGNPQLIEEVLVRHPKLKVQLMHMGFPYLTETKAIMYVYPQVYVDMAVVNWAASPSEFYPYLKSLMDAGFGKRIMYGSDQMGWPDVIGLSIKNVENVPFLTEAEKQDIFYNNALRFYNLKE